MELSIVIPVFNEVDNLVVLVRELSRVLIPLNRSYEIIVIDDASTDNTAAMLRELRRIVPELVVCTHRINTGQSAGIATGFQQARGRIIITMDGDLQNDPVDIPILLGNLGDDIDCVCGIRQKRMDNYVKKVSSKIGNAFRNRITGDTIKDAGCSYRAIRRSALGEVVVFNGMHRFLPTILRAQGYVVKEVAISHRPRTRGVTKYGVHNRLWRGILDCFAIRWYRRRSIPGHRY
jgi:glycosyltransferase involved in cell wall biosynthesis